MECVLDLAGEVASARVLVDFLLDDHCGMWFDNERRRLIRILRFYNGKFLE